MSQPGRVRVFGGAREGRTPLTLEGARAASGDRGARPRVRAWLTLLACLAPLAAAGQQLELVPLWRTGSLGAVFDSTPIEVVDVDGDGGLEIVSCANGAALILSYQGDGSYVPRWTSEELGCLAVATGDRDADGRREIYVGTRGDAWQGAEASGSPDREDPPSPKTTQEREAEVVILRLDQLGPVARFRVSEPVTDIGVADVDADGAVEIVVVSLRSTAVYDAETLQLEWEAEGHGGLQLGVGDLDGDGTPELVVNAENVAHVLDAASQVADYGWVGGFGDEIAVADVDGDGRSEVVSLDPAWGVAVLEPDAFTPVWTAQLGDRGPDGLAVADLDGDGGPDVVAGEGQGGYLRGFTGVDGTLLWSLQNPEYGIGGVTAGDVDADGVVEVIWSDGGDLLMVGDGPGGTVEWSSVAQGGPVYLAAGDVDDDGGAELVVASQSAGGGWAGGVVQLFDPGSSTPVWSVASALDIAGIRLGQVDSDAGLEVVIAGDEWYEPFVEVLDASTGASEWSSPQLGGAPMAALEVADLDGDDRDEIVVGFGDLVWVLEGASPRIRWDSGPLGHDVRDVAVGNLDDDAALELAILTSDEAHVVDAGTWTEQTAFAIEDGRCVLAVPDRVLVGTHDYGHEASVRAFSSSGDPIWTHPFEVDTVADLAAVDVAGEPHVVVGGGDRYGDAGRLLAVLSMSGFPDRLEGDHGLGMVHGVAAADVDGDGDEEVLLGRATVAEVDALAPVGTAAVALGSAQGEPGANVVLQLELTGDAPSLAMVAVDLELETGLSLVAARPGAAALAAGKVVSAGPVPGGARVSLSGVPDTAVGVGELAEVELAVAADAEPGVRPVPVALVSALDTFGGPLRLRVQDGAVTVSEGGPPACSGSPLWFIPAAAHSAGVSGTSWRTDLSVHNSGSTPTPVRAWFYPWNADNSGVECVDLGELAPGASLEMEDVVREAFGVEGAGGIGVGTDVYPAPQLVVNSRTYTETASGTYGQLVPGRTVAAAIAPWRTAFLTQLHENEGFRTNLGFLEVSGVGATVEVRLFAADGSLVSGRVEVLRPFEAKQVNRVFGVGAEVTGGYAEVRVSGGAVLAYASVVDNRTGDPTYVEPQ